MGTSSSSDQTSGKPVYRPLSCERIESALSTRSVLEVAWIIVAEDAKDGLEKVFGPPDGS